MSDAPGPADELNDIYEQIARLREQLDALMKGHVAAPAGDGAVCCAVKAVQHHAEELVGHIREEPILALLIATGVGFVLGRALR